MDEVRLFQGIETAQQRSMVGEYGQFASPSPCEVNSRADFVCLHASEYVSCLLVLS